MQIHVLQTVIADSNVGPSFPEPLIVGYEVKSKQTESLLSNSPGCNLYLIKNCQVIPDPDPLTRDLIELKVLI